MKALKGQFLAEQRILWRNYSSIFFTFVLPLALVFVVALTTDINDYIALIAVIGLFSLSFQGVAIQLAMHRDQGVLKRLMATPLPTQTLVLAKALSVMMIVLVEVLLVLAVGVIFFGVSLPENPLMLLVFLVLGTISFVALGFALASLIKTSEAAPAMANAAYLGMIMLTGLLGAFKHPPAAFSYVVGALPLSGLVGAFQRAWFGDDFSYLACAAVLIVWGLIGTWWTIKHFKWEPAHER